MAADSNKGTEPRLQIPEAGEQAQGNPTNSKEVSDVTVSDAGDGVVREVVAHDNNMVEKSKEHFAHDDMVVPVIELDQEDVDDWLGSDVNDEVVHEVVAEEVVVEKGNNEPSIVDDPIFCWHELVGSRG